MQETTKQKDYDVRIAEFQAATEQAKMDSVRLAADERRKILQEEQKLNQQKALYEDELARRRYDNSMHDGAIYAVCLMGCMITDMGIN